ncbi:MAG: hypothetical protein OXI11_07685 [Gammaproteobacteria bacterium]|nr:hypothetical protein [Gammaproteobacteria bacterium]MXW45127.1 hypothetical protein [Gammaproteobacteria bacterium]MYD01899.1 hypothetical protein [Gammaproteobacteria bacterium]MYI26108.1 hypothetical protein [Gammaproteobacteria bacterium]
MNELLLGMLGVVLGCSFGLAGIFLGVRYSNARSFGRLSKRVYLGIASGVMCVVVFPALMFRVVLPHADWVSARLWIALAALAVVCLMPICFHWWASRKS